MGPDPPGVFPVGVKVVPRRADPWGVFGTHVLADITGTPRGGCCTP